MLKLCKVIAIAALLHRRGDWTAIKQHERGTVTAQMKLFRLVAG